MDSILSYSDYLTTSVWSLLTLIVGLTVAGLMGYFCLRVRARKSSVYFNPTSRNEAIIAECQTMHLYDRVPLWGINGHAQSIYASQVRKGPTYELHRYVIRSFLPAHFQGGAYLTETALIVQRIVDQSPWRSFRHRLARIEFCLQGLHLVCPDLRPTMRRIPKSMIPRTRGCTNVVVDC